MIFRFTRMAVLWGACLTSVSHGGYLIEVDVDGADDGSITYSPDFGFGGDTTTASTSVASKAVGLSGADSIFGGDGMNEPDTYVYTYKPDAQTDNLVLLPGTDLGEGNTASGRSGGIAGLYDVYATWPFTTGVSGGLTTYDVITPGASLQALVDQNNSDLSPREPSGRGDVWVHLGSVNWTGGDIVVTQYSMSNTFVSMRAAAMLFERSIPEPVSLWMAFVAGVLVLGASRS